MTNIFQKILTGFSKNSHNFSNDYQTIDRIFDLFSRRLNTESDIQNYLRESLYETSEKTGLFINLFMLRGKNSSKWHDVLNNNAELKNASFLSYLEERFADIFNEDVKYHNLGVNENGTTKQITGFIAIRISGHLFYLLELSDVEEEEKYYRLLESKLRQLLRVYRAQSGNYEMRVELEHTNRELLQKERALRAAEKSTKRKVYELHNLVEASNEIYSILNLKQLLNSALLTIIGQVGFQSAFVLMFDEGQRTYGLPFQKGFKNEEIASLRFELDSPLVPYFLKHRTPVYTSRLERSPDLKDYAAKLSKLGVFLIAPIIYSERLHGLIGVGPKLYGQDFQQTDFEIYHILVNIISISIGNALLYESVKNLSLTDGMTGLHNFRYFEDRLIEELHRGRRNKSKVSLIILDLDHFKNYNDTLGHRAGDEALRTLGKVLKSSVRDEDIVTRYGGEEFGIILPGISKNGIKPLGERIRKQVESAKFYKEEVQPKGKITISLGGATFPDDADNNDDLVRRSDEALYKAKNNGRNQIVLYKNPNKG